MPKSVQKIFLTFNQIQFLSTKMINLRRSLSHLSAINRQATWGCRKIATSTSGNEEIEIPNRIQRSPTDILRALSRTVGKDPTAAHYKYHDDPYLIPLSNVAKRTYAMAQESGRKSAKWIRQENATLFQVTLNNNLKSDF